MQDAGPGTSSTDSTRTVLPACAPRDGIPRRALVSLLDLAADVGAPVQKDRQLAQLKFPVRQVRAGEFLYRAGDPCDAIYVVRAGFFKTVRVESNGTEQVMAFPMRGDAIGLDGVDCGKCQTDAVALDTSVVVAIAHDRCGQPDRAWPGVERLVQFLYSREIVQQQLVMFTLGSFCAEARVASFLLHLADKFGRFGFSRTALTLRMTRRDIGSYLGVKLETVSRCLSAFAAAGILDVHHRSLLLRDVDALRSVAAPPADALKPLRRVLAAKRTRSRHEPLKSGARQAATHSRRRSAGLDAAGFRQA